MLKCESCGVKAPPGTQPKEGEVLLCPDCSEGLMLIALLNLVLDGKCGMCDRCVAMSRVNSTGSTEAS